jgi:heme exporter protein B
VSLFADAAAVAAKDLTLMLRGRGGLVPVLLFGALAALVLAFALSAAIGHGPSAGAGVLWVVIFLAGELALTAVWRIEHETAALEGYLLSPADGLGLYLGKLAVGVVLMAAVGALALALYLLFFAGQPPRQPLLLAASVGLGGLGFMASGLLLGTLGGAARGSEGMVALILFPLLVPDLLASVATSESAFTGGTAGPWWRVLGGFDLLFLALALVLFETSAEVG